MDRKIIPWIPSVDPVPAFLSLQQKKMGVDTDDQRRFLYRLTKCPVNCRHQQKKKNCCPVSGPFNGNVIVSKVSSYWYILSLLSRSFDSLSLSLDVHSKRIISSSDHNQWSLSWPPPPIVDVSMNGNAVQAKETERGSEGDDPLNLTPSC